ncbi:hypothetical protein QEH56_13475 [Pelagicoccus enzymogenes]|uniref:nucleoside-diphosphate sugar epimerase/dehydratase n=1 Tax=Pelagicoccus enzymogenes TaxID=2773457 RepID=UPI0028104DE7|nr:hypothetical protein [Pelagicoccus enzymogenes]MDQ8199173.1 hypothetical protein [Pelagicoccus enzymogenes]
MTRSRKQENNPNSACLFYDLEVAPESYNFPLFLLLAKDWMAKRGISQSHLIIVPGLKDGYRTTGNPHAIDHSNWRLRQLLAPSALAFLPEASFTICHTREEAKHAWTAAQQKAAEVFPNDYSPDAPTAVFSIKEFCDAERRGEKTARFSPSPQSIEYLRSWRSDVVGDRRLIVITFRQANYQSSRNSDIDSWIRFAKSLDPARYYPILVPDTELALQQRGDIQGVPTFTEACFNLELRFALYQLAWLSMAVNTGPACLNAQTDNISYLHFKMVTRSINCSDLAYFEKERFYPGSQWPCANDTQILIWEDDHYDMITKAFEVMVDRKEGTGLWNDQRFEKSIRDELSADRFETASQWSACFVAFAPRSLEAWLLRAESLLSLERYHEALLTLISAQERFPHAAKQWGSRKIHPAAAGIGNAYAVLMKDGSAWRLRRSFTALSEQRLGQTATNKTCLIFGAGQGGKLAKNRLPHWLRPIGFIDNDPAKQNQTVDNLPIYNIHQTQALNYDYILIASMAAIEIFEQLCLEDIPVENVFFLEPEMILPR